MLSWLGKLLDRIAEGVVRRGHELVDRGDRVLEERRSAVRTVRDSITEAITNAESDRRYGNSNYRNAAIAAANRAASIVHEVDDEEARNLVRTWKAQFEAIPKGKVSDPFNYVAFAADGYPQPAWDELRLSSEQAQDRLGTVLRDLMQREK